MKSPLIKSTFLFLIIFFISLDVSARKLISDYKIEFGKINIGIVHWVIIVDEKNYKTSINLDDKGIFSGLFKFSGNYSADGEIFDNKFLSSKYYQYWKTKKKTKEVKINFKNKMVNKLSLKPKEEKSPKVDYSSIRGLTDPISSFLNILLGIKNNYKTIDGRRLYKMVVDTEKLIGNRIIKNIIITEYTNIWADHNRNDLDSIEIEQYLPIEKNLFPKIIKIKHKGLVFKLTLI